MQDTVLQRSDIDYQGGAFRMRYSAVAAEMRDGKWMLGRVVVLIFVIVGEAL